MLFNSFMYIVFFASVSILYYILPHKFRWPLLLISSYMFYMAWRPSLIILILFSTFINFILSKEISSSKNINNITKKRRLLILSLLVNFGLLFIFKYLTFINDTFMYLFPSYPIGEFDIILPMGISFYTFQAAGYTIDVYRGDTKPQQNFFKFSLFITFFPQLVAGPIERSSNLMPQLFTYKKFKLENIITGCKYLLLGFFKKVVIADRLSILVNIVYNSPEGRTGPAFALATVFFAFQIYCDFSGYSDIAVGSAKILGFDLMENFKQPYISGSVKEFWRRWHISLSTWFKDYVYIPLGGSRVSRPRRYFNLFITFLISGLWHGANWTFIIWGGLNGLIQIFEDLTGLYKNKLLKLLRLDVVLTFIVICFTWIFFRANTLTDSFYIISRLSSGWILDVQYLFNMLNSMGLSLFELAVCLCLIVFLYAADIAAGNGNIYTKMESLQSVCRFFFYLILAAAICSMGVFFNAGQFIYFQF